MVVDRTTRSRDSRLARDTRKAIDAGIDLLRAEGHQARFPESLSAIVWRLLQEAADTLRRVPDRERAWLTAGDRIGWPEVIHSAQEHWEAELQRLVDVKMSKEATPLPRLPVSDPSAIPRMLTVLSWLRFMKARNPSRLKRDKLVILAMAQGAPRRHIRYLMHGAGDSAASMLKTRALRQIGQALLASCDTDKCVAN